MNGWKRVFRFERSMVQAGGCLYSAILLLIIVGIAIGISILINHALFPPGGPIG